MSNGYYGETDPELFGDARVFCVKARRLAFGRAFANNKWDSGEGVLLLKSNCFVPVFDPDLDRPRFSEHALLLPEFPLLEQQVTCDVERANRDRFLATRWAPTKVWLNADGMYRVMRQDGTKLMKVWEGYGTLDLSSYFPSSRLEKDGTIWRSNNGEVVYRLYEVDWDHADREFDVPLGPDEDPRLPLEWLPEEFHDLSMLPDK